jgi:hypothetical protein
VGIPHVLRRVIKSRHTGPKVRELSALFFSALRRDRKKSLCTRNFFLEEPERGGYAVPRKGEGEDEESVVNNVLIAWTFSHVSLVGHMQRPGHADFSVHRSPEPGTNVIMGKCSCTTV